MSFTIDQFLAKILGLFGDLTDDVIALANEAAVRFPDAGLARDHFITEYVDKWKAELGPEQAAARGALIWAELRATEKPLDEESGSSI